MITDSVIEIEETTDEFLTASKEIHEMIEHITEHIEKCQLVYMDQDKKGNRGNRPTPQHT
jgi:hypothetical protein